MDFRLFSTKIYISYYFCALVCLTLLTDRSGMALMVFSGVLIHETAHLAVMCFYGLAPTNIVVSPGGFTVFGRASVPYFTQLKISLAGPFVNIIGAFVFYSWFIATKREELLLWFGVWLILGAVNLLPSAGLDGGTALFSTVSQRKDVYTAKNVLRAFSVVTAICFIVFTVFVFKKFGFNPSFIIFALYLCMACMFKI